MVDSRNKKKKSWIYLAKIYYLKKIFEKAIKDTIIKYKDIIFGVENPTCVKSLDEFKK